MPKNDPGAADQAPKKRIRHRPNAVMIDLEPAERAKLEALRDHLEQRTGVKVGLTGTVRHLIRHARPRSQEFKPIGIDVD